MLCVWVNDNSLEIIWGIFSEGCQPLGKGAGTLRVRTPGEGDEEPITITMKAAIY